MTIRLISTNDKDTANGMRDTSKTPLTESEIEYVKSEIQRIGADLSVFVFNDEEHLSSSTCYNFVEDKIYVTRNVFPDEKYGSTHPRDLMGVGAVLAHEYFGHRPYREEYLSDMEQGDDYHTTPIWQDECRASINAAKIAHNLTDRDKSNLVMDAIYRAKEFGYLIEMDDFMKEVVYGYSNGEKNISYNITPISYVSEASEVGATEKRICDSSMSKMSRTSRDYYDFER
ncbi:MAG: hypothetical protein PUG10_09335 [Lachnospiraceae bacterium]|nr:hypothetical protein [Lachnospiraceae bacterium]